MCVLPSLVVTDTFAVQDLRHFLFFMTVPHLVHSAIILSCDFTLELHLTHN